jgi:hypothetical protein
VELTATDAGAWQTYRQDFLAWKIEEKAAKFLTMTIPFWSTSFLLMLFTLEDQRPNRVLTHSP